MRSIGHPFLAEIGLDDAGVAGDGFRLALDDDGAMVENEETVDQANHRLHRVLDDGDRHAVPRQPLNPANNLVPLVIAEPPPPPLPRQGARLPRPSPRAPPPPPPPLAPLPPPAP